MRLRLWGTRGSIASAGPDTVRYGGDTSSVELLTNDGALVVLDAGSGIRLLGNNAGPHSRVDILLSHLHMDHVQGLPFFRPLLNPDVDTHIWGPISTTRDLRSRISRYLSPPLFPVRVRDLPNVTFHDVTPSTFRLGSLEVTADLITHPGATLGYRIAEGDKTVAYLSDHEPAFGTGRVLDSHEWTSGSDLARGVDVLVHDAQYTDEEYSRRVGWGHTSLTQLVDFTHLVEARRLVTFHHDPAHSDAELDVFHEQIRSTLDGVQLSAGTPELEINTDD
ncbi:MAG: MBL fold metallo-hydrolase [Acidimicrobiia bacterium]